MLLTDPRVAAVPVQECGEPVIDVLAEPDERIRLDVRERNATGGYRLLRAGVLTRLSRAAATLPAGLGLLIIEGWRDPEDQRQRFTAHLQSIARRHPQLDPATLRDRTAAFVSPVDVAPHCTGAAVDLTLFELSSGSELDLGCAVNAHRDGDERLCPFATRDLSTGARAHRDLLAAAMAGAGFVNYPSEWWHWSIGERYWAAATQAPAARHGPTKA